MDAEERTLTFSAEEVRILIVSLSDTREALATQACHAEGMPSFHAYLESKKTRVERLLERVVLTR